MFFEFPEDARWNDESDCVEFSVLLGPYEGTARIARRVFQGLLDQSPTPERCMEAFHLQRTRFEMIVERKLRRRQLTDDGNVEITGRDLREKTPPIGQGSLFETGGVAFFEARIEHLSIADRVRRMPRHDAGRFIV